MKIGPVNIGSKEQEVVPKRSWFESCLGGLFVVLFLYFAILWLSNQPMNTNNAVSATRQNEWTNSTQYQHIEE